MAFTSSGKWLIAFCISSYLFCCSGQRVAAQSQSGQISISPAFQEVILTEGVATASASIQLHNQSQRDQAFTLQAIEIQQFDTQGNVSLEQKPLDAQNQNEAKFITLPLTNIALAAGQKVSIPVTVNNLISLSPGGHYAAFIARLESSEAGNQVLSALSAFLLVHKVGGEQFNLSLTATSFPSQVWWRIPTENLLTFSNQGNVHVIPRGSVAVFDVFGRLVAQGTINESSLYVFPSTQRELKLSLHPAAPAIPFLPLTFSVTGYSQPGQVIFSQSGWVLFFPPAGLLLVGALGLTVIFLLYRRNRYALAKK